MKTRTIIIAILITLTTMFAQNEREYLVKISDVEIGGYLGFNGRVSSLESKAVGFADFKAALTFDGGWAVGIMGSFLYHDRSADELVTDGTYRLKASYGSVFVEKMFTLNEDLILSLSIASGSGEAFYQYNKDYRKEKVWSDEIIDKTTFAMFEPGMEIQYRVSGNWWIGIMGTYRNTSPIEMIGTDENLLRNFTGGVSVKWGLL